MLGAMIGDYVGSIYEFDFNNIKTEDFPFFGKGCAFTDDSVMTIAVAEALMSALENGMRIEDECVRTMREWGRRYPSAGYGGRFRHWLASEDPRPYGSWGNGSAMRVSPAGWLFETLERTEAAAAATAATTHNHPEGIKGAQAVAACIFLARNGATKAEIKRTVEERYGYVLDRTLAEIRPGYHMDESCKGSVPEAITAFLESEGYEDAVRKAVSIGGDSDTIACIAGSIAEAAYGIPGSIARKGREELPADMADVFGRWEAGLERYRKLAKTYGFE